MKSNKDDVLCAKLQVDLFCLCLTYDIQMPIGVMIDDEGTYGRIVAQAQMTKTKNMGIMMRIPSYCCDWPYEDLLAKTVERFKDMHGLMSQYRLTHESHPALLQGFEALCRENGIEPIPDLYGSRSPFLSANSGLMIGPEMLSYPVKEVLGILAHEIGHQLYRDKKGRDGEWAADETSARMLHSAKPLISALAKYHRHRQDIVDKALASGDGYTRRGGEVFGIYLDRMRSERYGTEEERFAHLRQVRPEDRSDLDSRLEQRRNAAKDIAAQITNIVTYVDRIFEEARAEETRSR